VPIVAVELHHNKFTDKQSVYDELAVKGLLLNVGNTRVGKHLVTECLQAVSANGGLLGAVCEQFGLILGVSIATLERAVGRVLRPLAGR
jgi:hypothetical protein